MSKMGMDYTEEGETHKKEDKHKDKDKDKTVQDWDNPRMVDSSILRDHILLSFFE